MFSFFGPVTAAKKIAFVSFLDCGRALRENGLFKMQIPDLPTKNQVAEVQKSQNLIKSLTIM